MNRAGGRNFRVADRMLLSNKRTVRAVLMLWLPVLGLSASDVPVHPVPVRDHSIEILASSEEEAFGLKPFFRRCSEEVDAFLRPASSVDRTVVFSVGYEALAGEEPVDAALAPDESMHSLVHRTVRVLLARRALRFGSNLGPESLALDWMAAALTNRIVYTSRPGSLSRPDFGVPRAAFLRGRFPGVGNLLGHSVSPENFLAYRIYAVHCQLLAKMLDGFSPGTGESCLLRVLELQARGHPPVEAVTMVLQEFSEADQDLQDWYETNALRAGTGGGRPCSADEIAERLCKLESIQVVHSGRGGLTAERIGFDQLPEWLESYELDTASARRKERQFYELMKDSPFLLREPILDYVAAFQILARGKDRQFLRRLRDAREHFESACVRQNKVAAYLEHVESRKMSLERRYALYLYAFRRSESDRRALDADLYQYLGELAPMFQERKR